ncbi:19414_t:CDS:2, partial [Cetraspora pellucida]
MDPTSSCYYCSRKVVSYPKNLSKKLCRSNTLSNKPPSSCGNKDIDTFIQDTKSRKQHCDDFVEWIPYSDINIDKAIAKGSYSEIFVGKWEPLKQIEVVNHKESTNLDIVLKVLAESKNSKPEFLKEIKIHYQCLGKCAIPFYGLTEHAQGYAMVLKRAICGDLREFIDHNELTWINKIEVLSSIAKSLNALHELNIVHRDFHCKNILIDDDTKVFISDFGISSSEDSPTSNEIIGVLPYIAPEVLSGGPYTKQSDIYSFGIIMWDLTSRSQPFSNQSHDLDLAKNIVLGGLRPDVVDGTPEAYKMIMEKCWDSDPSKRPNSSQLIELIENIIKNVKHLNQLPCIITSRCIPRIVETPVTVEETTSPEIVTDQKDDSITNQNIGAIDNYDEQQGFIVPNDEVVGIIRICIKSAKGLKKSDFWFACSNPDPYVRIMNAAGTEIVRTRVCHGTVTPKWDEVHFVSVYRSCEKISFEIFDENLFVSDKPLGTFVLDTNTLMRSEDYSKPVSDWFPLEIGNKSTKGHLNLEVQFIHTAFTDDQEFVFNRETIKLHHVYMLISWRKANGSFEFTDKLAHFFNYKSVDELKEGFLKHIFSDKELSKCDLSILSTALTIMYLKILCWKHYNEWKQIISNSEVWVSKEINGINTEDRLYDLCRKFMIERFKVTNLEKEQLEIIQPVKPTIITRKHIIIRYIRKLIGHQNDNGCVVLNKKVADYYGFKSVEEFLQHLRKYFKTERVTKLHHNVWVTACTIWYLRLIAVDHRHEWIANYEKSSKWLTRQCNGDTNLENEIMECGKKFIVERYEVDKEAIEADYSFIAA